MASVAFDGGQFEVPTENLTRQGSWLVSRGYDMALIILSAVLVITPSFARP